MPLTWVFGGAGDTLRSDYAGVSVTVRNDVTAQPAAGPFSCDVDFHSHGPLTL